MDCIFDWVRVFDGHHRSISGLTGHLEELNKYDVVMLVDANRYLNDAVTIARDCSCKTIFVPEGTIRRYLELPFDHFKIFHELMSNVDLIGMVEEDRTAWYESLWGEKTFFMHTPSCDTLLSGGMKVGKKTDRMLICCNLGLGHPQTATNLITALGVLKRTKKHCILCEIEPREVDFIVREMGIENLSMVDRTPYSHYISRVVAPSILLLNPSELIGTSRNAIVGAGVGTPVIGNMHSHTQKRIFPDLGVYIYDVNAMVDLVNRLYDDPVFYKEVCEKGFEAAQHYSTKNAIKRFQEAVAAIL